LAGDQKLVRDPLLKIGYWKLVIGSECRPASPIAALPTPPLPITNNKFSIPNFQSFVVELAGSLLWLRLRRAGFIRGHPWSSPEPRQASAARNFPCVVSHEFSRLNPARSIFWR